MRLPTFTLEKKKKEGMAQGFESALAAVNKEKEVFTISIHNAGEGG